MKWRLLLIACIIVLASGSMLILAVHSSRATKNGFTRSFRALPTENMKEFELAGQFYIAGFTNTSLYLANASSSRVLTVFFTRRRTLGDTTSIVIGRPAQAKIQIDSPFYYLEEAVNNKIQLGRLSDHELIKLVNGKITIVDSEPIGNSSLFIKTFNEQGSDFVIAKKTFTGLQRFPSILQKQIDGKFCTDGILKFHRPGNLMVYVYYYRNEVICFDTTATHLYRFRTIDTTTHANISIAEISSEHSTTLSSPPRIVNRQLAVCNNLLLINSNLVADNEDRETFKQNKVIDVYTLSGQYNFSFYLPPNRGHLPIDYGVVNDRLILLYPHGVHIIPLHGFLTILDRV